MPFLECVGGPVEALIVARQAVGEWGHYLINDEAPIDLASDFFLRCYSQSERYEEVIHMDDGDGGVDRGQRRAERAFASTGWAVNANDCGRRRDLRLRPAVNTGPGGDERG